MSIFLCTNVDWSIDAEFVSLQSKGVIRAIKDFFRR
jgi:hypothetical protein